MRGQKRGEESCRDVTIAKDAELMGELLNAPASKQSVQRPELFGYANKRDVSVISTKQSD